MVAFRGGEGLDDACIATLERCRWRERLVPVLVDDVVATRLRIMLAHVGRFDAEWGIGRIVGNQQRRSISFSVLDLSRERVTLHRTNLQSVNNLVALVLWHF